nr:homeodomain-containing protein [Tanacetum cinerariifolium]
MYNDNISKNHREEEDQERNNLPDIETLPLFPIHGGSQHDFFGMKASDLLSDHSVRGYYTARMVGTQMDITTDFDTIIPLPPLCTNSFDVAKLKRSDKRLTKRVNIFMRLFRSDDKFSQMLTQLESQPEYSGGTRSGRSVDDELGDDEDGGEDGEDEDDS